MTIQNEHNACLIHQNNLVAKSSSLGQKLQTALHLFIYLIHWTLISIDNLIPEFQVIEKIYLSTYLAFLSAFYQEKLKRKYFSQRSFRVVRGLFELGEVSLRSFLAY